MRILMLGNSFTSANNLPQLIVVLRKLFGERIMKKFRKA